MVLRQIELDKARTSIPTEAPAPQRSVQPSKRTRTKSNCKIALTPTMDRWWLRYLLSTLRDLDRFSTNSAKLMQLVVQETMLPIIMVQIMSPTILPMLPPISPGIQWLCQPTTTMWITTNKEVLVLVDWEELAHSLGKRTTFLEVIQATQQPKIWARTQVKTATSSTHLQLLQISQTLIPLQTKILPSNQPQSRWTTAQSTKIIRILQTWVTSWIVWIQPLRSSRINSRTSSKWTHMGTTSKTA